MSTMREDLDAALDSVDESGETYEETTQVVDEVEETTSEGDNHENDDSGTEDANAEKDTASGEISESESDASPSDSTKLEGDSIKAPVGWGAKEREDWSKIPRHLQEKVMGREKELNTMMQTTADARRTHDQFGKLTQQYGAVLSGVMGDTPMETVSNLFSTVANLRVGSPIQKAQIIADLIEDFGVDINTLDSAIVGAAPSAETQQNSQFEKMFDARMAPFQEMMGQQNALTQQQEGQRAEAANNEVAEFGKTAEFLNDVRDDMADFMDMAAKRGENLSMKDAYEKACMLNPQVSAVIAGRHKMATLKSGNNTMATKRLAASSVNGGKGGDGGGGGNNSMRDTIASAWDNQNSV